MCLLSLRLIGFNFLLISIPLMAFLLLAYEDTSPLMFSHYQHRSNLYMNQNPILHRYTPQTDLAYSFFQHTWVFHIYTKLHSHFNLPRWIIHCLCEKCVWCEKVCRIGGGGGGWGEFDVYPVV